MYRYYHFRDPETQEEGSVFMSPREYKKFKKEYPALEELIGSPLIISGRTGSLKPDKDFQNLLTRIKREHRSNAINDF